MSKITLRTYQNEAISRIKENYKNNIARNLVVMGTGLGKTILAVFLHLRFKPHAPTLFLVNRIDLAYQTRDEFINIDPSLSVGIEMNDNHASEDDDVVIASIDTIGRKGTYRIGKFNRDHFNKVIVDEAHFSVSDIYTRVLNYLQVGPDNLNSNKLLVGLTATPERTDGVSLGHVYDEIVVNYDIRFGIKKGYLTDICLYRVDSGIDVSDDKYYTATDFNTEELDKAINIAARNTLIVKSYLDISKGEPFICYTNSVDHAYELREVFKKYDVKTEVIEAHTPKEDRKRYIRQYKKGRIHGLLNFGTMVYGFNAPETSTIILGRLVRSELLIRQIIGRGLRPSQYAFVDAIKTDKGRRKAILASGKPYCKVIDIRDSVGEHDIVSVPSLFGLNPNLVGDIEEKPFLKEVVEPLEDLEEERNINIREIENLDEVELIVEKEQLNVSSLQTPEEIQMHTDRNWVEGENDSYEILYKKDKKKIIVSKKDNDKYEVIVQNIKGSNAKKLNEFYSLSAAIKLGDEYANKYFNTQWTQRDDRGVTRPQFNLLKKLYKGRIGVSTNDYYEDTKVPKLYDRQLKEPIKNRSHASELIQRR